MPTPFGWKPAPCSHTRFGAVDEGMMREAAEKLAALHQADSGSKLSPVVVALTKAN
jgi:hypothetical protein